MTGVQTCALPIYLEIIPTTFILPADYTIFVDEFRHNPNTTWIMKPSCKSQGQGIFLVSKLGQLKKWATSSKLPFQALSMKENYVISRYVDNPLLVGGKKFDLRIYVLVTCFKPLHAYLYHHGFTRFCNEKYTAASECPVGVVEKPLTLLAWSDKKQHLLSSWSHCITMQNFWCNSLCYLIINSRITRVSTSPC